jgi:hypothetical protein
VFYDKMVEAGWIVIRTGWPDFLCFRNHEICAVEVKPDQSQGLKKSQAIVMNLLASLGLKCYKWDAEKGFTGVVVVDCYCEEDE